MNGRVAEYSDLAESLARRYVGRNGAELEDLVQEGMISAWQALERGVTPSADILGFRMENWVRLLGRQTGRYVAPNGAAVSYETLLPLDDFQHLTADPAWDALA